jgi:hypothetical protein
LRKRPTGDDIGNGNLVNVASLYLREKVVQIHQAEVRKSFG